MFEVKGNGKKLVVGIDVAKAKHYAFIHGNGEKPFAFSNDRSGFAELLRRISVAKQRQRFCEEDPVEVGLEPTGHYWKALGYALKDEPGFTVALVNPYHTKLCKELRDNSPLKNDSKDSRVITDLTLEGKTLGEHLLEGPYANLRRYDSLWRYLNRQWQGISCRLEALLNEYFPEYESCFDELLGPTSRSVLSRYGFPWRIRQERLTALGHLIGKASRGKLGKERAKEIWDLAHHTLGHERGRQAAECELKLLLEQAKQMERHQADLEEAMERELQLCEESEYLMSFPGVGVVTASGFLGQTGPLKAYRRSADLEKMAGINLVEASSGKHQGRRRFSKRGRGDLRHVLYLITIVAISKNKQFSELYRNKFQAVSGKPKMKIVGHMMAKVLRVLFSLGKGHHYYDVSRIYQDQRTGS